MKRWLRIKLKNGDIRETRVEKIKGVAIVNDNGYCLSLLMGDIT